MPFVPSWNFTFLTHYGIMYAGKVGLAGSRKEILISIGELQNELI